MVEIILAVLIGVMMVWMFWITRRSLQLEQVAHSWQIQQEAIRQQNREKCETINGPLEPAVKSSNTVKDERDEYLKALYFLLREDFSFTEEELREMETNGVSLDSVLDELKQGNRKQQ